MKLNSQKVKSLFLLSLLNSASAKDKKAKPKQQTGTSSPTLLPKLATNLTAGGENTDPTFFFTGMPIFFRGEVDQGRCVTSFAITPTKENDPNACEWSDDDGFLTSTLCCREEEGACTSDTVFLVADNPLWIGEVGNTALAYRFDNPFTDFGFVSKYGNLRLSSYVIGGSDNGSLNFYPVIGLGSVVIGSEVCAYGPIAGYHCGEVVDMDLSRWTDSGVGPLFFKNLNKVDLGDYGLFSEQDLGAPVYTVSNIGDQTIIAQALGYISKVDNSDQHHKFIYYTPIDKALEMIADKNKCHYTLMTYNETSAEEFHAQIEIPPKN